jgi:hypothetical protein
VSILFHIFFLKAKSPSRVTTSITTLKDACDNALLVATETANESDWVSVCGIYDHQETGLIPFLPLAMHDLDTIKRVFKYLPHLEQRVDRTRQSDVESAVREASNMLIQLSSRGALCHIFLVTADSTLHLPDDLTEGRVQLHTISPDPIFGSKIFGLNGFHLSYGTCFGDSPIAKQAQMQKVKFLFKQLRMGYDPGTLSDLTLTLIPGSGYMIESVLGDSACNALRPGEKWSVVVRVQFRNQPNAGNFGYSSDRIDDLMDQLFTMLEGSPAYDETILSASLEYKHSCLPNSAIVKIERRWEAPKTPRLGAAHFGYQSGDRCVSAISGNLRACSQSFTQDVTAEPSDDSDTSNEELDNQPLNRGDPGYSNEGISSLDTDFVKPLLRNNVPSSSAPFSKIRRDPCEILGDATNKDRSNENGKPSAEVINPINSTLENKKPRKEPGKRFTNEWFALGTEDIPETTQLEWHDIGWC